MWNDGRKDKRWRVRMKGKRIRDREREREETERVREDGWGGGGGDGWEGRGGVRLVFSVSSSALTQCMHLQPQLNPSNLPKGADLSQNLDRLETHLQHLLTTIFNSTDRCPP